MGSVAVVKSKFNRIGLDVDLPKQHRRLLYLFESGENTCVVDRAGNAPEILRVLPGL